MRLPKDSTPLMRETYAAVRLAGREGLATPDLLKSMAILVPGTTVGHLRAVLVYLKTTGRIETSGRWRGHRGMPSIIRAARFSSSFLPFARRPVELRLSTIEAQIEGYKRRCVHTRCGPTSTEPRLLQLLSEVGSATTESVVAALGITTKTAKERLLQAYRNGMVERDPCRLNNRPSYSYRLSPAGRALFPPDSMAAR